MSELGDMLRAARQKHNLSLIDIADRTHIRPGYLEALESGEYGHLPGPAYITGFLRNYAQAVGLHPDEIIQEYYASRPIPEPSVKPATRVLANGYERQHRTRLLWALTVVAIFLGSGYAFKLYTDRTYAQKYSPSLITPANLGATPVLPPPAAAHPLAVRIGLHAVAPVWVRVTVDGIRQFQGTLRPRMGVRHWRARHSIYVATWDGARVRVVVNGRPRGVIAHGAGLVVNEASASGWRLAS